MVDQPPGEGGSRRKTLLLKSWWEVAVKELIDLEGVHPKGFIDGTEPPCSNRPSLGTTRNDITDPYNTIDLPLGEGGGNKDGGGGDAGVMAK